ncbi:siphovirus Gp157 family protein [Bacillus sp. COPE52]|uniref:siphovirus Gp157 family protein n=1 Tax=Bacillus sp. COPE52 TaxID=2233998 RepID=UPI000E102019|nr:siphovirus Gp157 family protein [Bacillus sp. COPE52]AXK19159.1 ATPase [Bacillus sp. COPE52]
MTSLYNLTGDFLQIQRMIEDGVDLEVIADTLEAVEEAIDQKALNTAYVIKTNEAVVSIIKEEEKRLANRRKALENANKRLSDFLSQSLQVAEKEVVKNETITINFRNNAPSLDIKEGAAIPSKYYNTPVPAPVLDRKKLLDDVKGGLEIEGVGTKRTKSLQIK